MNFSFILNSSKAQHFFLRLLFNISFRIFCSSLFVALCDVNSKACDKVSTEKFLALPLEARPILEGSCGLFLQFLTQKMSTLTLKCGIREF